MPQPAPRAWSPPVSLELRSAAVVQSVTQTVPALAGVRRLLPAAFTGATATSASLAVAWALTHGMAPFAAMLAVFVPLTLMLLARPVSGFHLAIVLAVIVPSTWYFAMPQAAAPRLAAMAALGAVVLGAQQRRAPLKLTLCDLGVAAFATLVLLSWLLDDTHPPDSLQLAINYATPLALYAAGRRFGWFESRPVLWTLLAAGAIAALTVHYEFLVSHTPLISDKDAYYWNERGDFLFRPGGVLMSPPGAATVLAMIALATFPLASTSRGARRLVARAALAIVLAAVAVTFTRGSTISLLVGGVVLVVIARPRQWPRIAMGLALAAIVVPLLVAMGSGARWYQAGVLREGTFEVRQTYWRLAWPLVTRSAEQGLIGHGVNSLIVGGPQLPGAEDPDIATVPILKTVSPHNQYLRTLLEQGAVGLTAALVWLVGALVMAWRAATRCPQERLLLAAGAAAVVSALVASLVGDTFRHAPTLGVLALLSGILVTRAQLACRMHRDQA